MLNLIISRTKSTNKLIAINNNQGHAIMTTDLKIFNTLNLAYAILSKIDIISLNIDGSHDLIKIVNVIYDLVISIDEDINIDVMYKKHIHFAIFDNVNRDIAEWYSTCIALITQNKIGNFKKMIYRSIISISQLHDADVCPICMEMLHKDKSITKCNHMFHSSCLATWLQMHDTCPMCRTNILT